MAAVQLVGVAAIGMAGSCGLVGRCGGSGVMSGVVEHATSAPLQ